MTTSLIPAEFRAGEQKRVRYDVLERLAKGVLWDVFEVLDLASGDVVVLKRLRLQPDARTQQRMVRLFERQYLTLAELAHSSVARVYDYGVDGQGPYYTMELLGGVGLARRAPAPWRSVCEWMRDLCSVLCMLHARQLVHRDLGPHSVRFSADGEVRVVDFAALAPLRVTGEATGCSGFFPRSADCFEPLDARADLFSLASLGYFALTGERAHPPSELGAFERTRDRPVRPPSQLARGVPAELDGLILAMLGAAAEPGPASAERALGLLDDIVTGARW